MRLTLPTLGAAIFLAGCGGSAGETPEGVTATVSEDEALSPAALDFKSEGWKTDFRRRAVGLDEFLSGGPPKDGIPALDRPKFLRVDAVDYLEPREPVLALEVEGQARAYPLQIMTWHEIVNDTVAGVPVAVTFCPLCNTAIVFDRRLGGRTLDFGTTGKLRNSDLVMYDRQTESWWQQFGGAGLVGRYAGERLTRVPARIASWADFRREFPGGRVLSRDTGHSRPYGENPYSGYDDVGSPPIFPATNLDDDRLEPKERVVFLELGGESVAVPFTALRAKKVIRLEAGGRRLVVRWRPGVASALDSASIPDGRDVGSAEVTEKGRLVPFEEPFWFAVAAFRPDVRIVR